MKQNYLNWFISLLITCMILFALYMQYAVIQSTEKMKNEEIKKSLQYAQRITALIKLKTGKHIETSLNNHPEKREELNNILQAFFVDQYQYIFLLQKDHQGHYRFLLDGSKEDRAEYKSIFFPQSELFDEVYTMQKYQVVKQQSSEVESIWLSLVYPVVIDGKTEALLVLDLSEAYGKGLETFNSPLLNLATLMQAFLFLSLVLMIYLFYKYYKVRRAIMYDALTSTHTKVFLEEFFNKHHVDQYNAILIDIDEFKNINAIYSYEVGNMVIQNFAALMKEVLAQYNAVIIRAAGTEFFVIVPKKAANITILAQKLFKVLSQKQYFINEEFIHMSVSMSAMEIPQNTSSIYLVQRQLDEKLLEIKSKGKNRLEIVAEDDIMDSKYKNLDYLKEAFEEQRFVCFYQPVVSTLSKEIVKYEVLVRLIDDEDPNHFISPSIFMSTIRGTSQYIKLSKIVLNQAFETLSKYPEIELSVNLNLNDFYNNDLMKMIRQELLNNQKMANRLTFEILEDHEIKDFDQIMLMFRQLKEFGSKIAIDDFGSGYANFSYLLRFDIDIVKIDGSLIKELHVRKEKTIEVLQTIQRLVSVFGCDLVAEHVADEEIYEVVKTLGIEYSQGFYFGKPEPLTSYIKS